MPSASDNMTSLCSVETLVIVEIASQFLDSGRYALPYRKSSRGRFCGLLFLMTSDKWDYNAFVQRKCVSIFFLLSAFRRNNVTSSDAERHFFVCSRMVRTVLSVGWPPAFDFAVRYVAEVAGWCSQRAELTERKGRLFLEGSCLTIVLNNGIL